ncbi:MAG: hypothetical protein WDZ28_04725 [Simkaniaceae bacterium]
MKLTLIQRHRRENLKKCSLRGLESREDMRFFTYPKDPLPDLNGYCQLAIDGEELSIDDRHLGLFLIDGTWKYAKKMEGQAPSLIKRRLPSFFKTAYPRKQPDCEEPESGLASVEALYIAYQILGYDTKGLLDQYYWARLFLEKNAPHFDRINTWKN